MKNLVLPLFALLLGSATVVARQPAAAPPVPTPPGPLPPPAVAPTNSAAATNTLGPKIQFATPVYDFGRAKAGELVKHAYIFTNFGDQVLEIKSVQPGCGCTTVGEWTKQVEPGKTGSIAIQFNTANFNGAVLKTPSVTCNDRATPTVVLQLKGTVWKPIDVSPLFAVLNVTADTQNASAVVRILNNMDEPLTLSDPQCNNRAFAVEIKTNQPGKDFQLVVSTVPPLAPGVVQGVITVKTSSTNAPVITATAFANVPPVLVVVPAQLVLPPAPLPNDMTLSVMIRNNSTNDMTLSDPAINLKNVEVQLTEAQPGRTYSALVKFPRGFAIPDGQPVELTCKSSHIQYPVVKIPVIQSPRPPVPHPMPPAATPPPPVHQPSGH